jgi:hypothetical protein
MEKVFLGGYFALLIIFIIVFLVNYSTINKFEKASKSINNYYECVEKIKNYRNSIVKDDIELKKGKVCFFDANKKYISFVEKENYKEYDLFVFSHEIGHSIECYKHHVIYTVISIVNVFVLLFYIANVVINVVFIIKHPFSRNLLIIFNSVTIFLFAVKLFSLYWIEKKASLQALKIMDKFGELSVSYDNVINLSIANQYVFNFLIFSTFFISFIFSVLFNR